MPQGRPEHGDCDTATADLTAEAATRRRPRRGHAGQRADSRSGAAGGFTALLRRARC